MSTVENIGQCLLNSYKAPCVAWPVQNYDRHLHSQMGGSQGLLQNPLQMAILGELPAKNAIY